MDTVNHYEPVSWYLISNNIFYPISYECNHFGVAEPSFPIAEELKQDITVNEAMWQIYEEFSNGIEDLAKEDWISFRYYEIVRILLVLILY